MLIRSNISEVLNTQGVIIDVRSESEFVDSHLPGAVSLPLLGDAERAEVGTVYKKQGPEQARRLGLSIVQPKLSTFTQRIAEFLSCYVDLGQVAKPTKIQISEIYSQIENAALSATIKTMDVPVILSQPESVKKIPVVIYCWRGGERSASMALFFKALGFNVSVLHGGHKAFRTFVQEYISAEKPPLKFCTVYGLTGAAKTKTLKQWQGEGKPVIDLEGLAHHRGSAFGQIGIAELGRQKEFENNLFYEMWKLEKRGEKFVVLEGESRRIGLCQLPEKFHQAMQSGVRVKMECDLDQRVQNILSEYVDPVNDESIQRDGLRSLDALKRRLGGEAHKELTVMLKERNYAEFTKRLLTDYYDKMYAHSREGEDFYQLKIKGPDDWPLIEKFMVI